MKKICFILIWLLLGACTRNHPEVSDKKILNQLSVGLSLLDPHLRKDLATGRQLAKVYEALIDFNPYKATDNIIPGLAAEMPKISDDGLTYTFGLKKNVLYHPHECMPKGRIVKAKDFVTSFKRVADPHLVTAHLRQWNEYLPGLQKWYDNPAHKQKTDFNVPLEGIDNPDDHTLVFHFAKPSPIMLYWLTALFLAPLPQEALECLNNDLSNTTLGTGPFLIKEYVRKSNIIFVKNPHYRDEFFPTEADPKYASIVKEYGGRRIPLLDEIHVRIENEAQSMFLNFMRGRVDFIEVPKDNYSEAFAQGFVLTEEMKRKGIRLGMDKANNHIYYLGFNNQHGLLKNKNIRKAIGYAFDYDRFNELFFNGVGQIPNSMIPPGIPGNSESIKNPYRRVELEKAKKLSGNLKVSAPLRVLVKNSTLGRQIGEYVIQQLAKINIPAKLETFNLGELIEKAQKGDYDIFFLAWFTGTPSALEFFDMIYGKNYPGAYNRVGYQNPDFDRLFEKASLEMNPQKHDALVEKMIHISLEELPIFPLIHATEVWIYQGWVKNYQPSELNFGIEKYYDVDNDLKRKWLEKF